MYEGERDSRWLDGSNSRIIVGVEGADFDDGGVPDVAAREADINNCLEDMGVTHANALERASLVFHGSEQNQ